MSRISKEMREKMFDAYRNKQTVNYVSKETGISYPTCRSYFLKDKWAERLLAEKAVIQNAGLKDLVVNYEDHMDVLKAIIKKIACSIMGNDRREHTIGDLKTTMELYLMMGGIPPELIGNKGQMNMNVQVNTNVTTGEAGSTVESNVTILSSEDRTKIYKIMNEAKDRPKIVEAVVVREEKENASSK